MRNFSNLGSSCTINNRKHVRKHMQKEFWQSVEKKKVMSKKPKFFLGVGQTLSTFLKTWGPNSKFRPRYDIRAAMRYMFAL